MKLYRSHLWDCIEKHAASDPDSICIVPSRGHAISFKQLIQKVHEFACSYMNQDISDQSRILLLIPPSTDFLIAFLALERIGATIVLADVAMGNALFESRVRMADITHIVTTQTIRFILQSRILSTVLRFLKIPVPIFSDSRTPIIAANTREQTHPMLEKEESVDPEKEFLIIFTSGTTSEPKGVMHTYQSMTENFQRMMTLLQERGARVICSSQPYILLPALAIGGTALLPRYTDKPKGLLKTMIQHQVDTVFMLPTDLKNFIFFLQQTGQKFPRFLRNIAVGSAPVYASFLRKIQDMIPSSVSVWCIYGLTEILPVSMVEMREKIRWQEPGDFIGAPLPGITASVADDGELLLKGKGLYSRYLGQAACSGLATGDLCKIVKGNIILLGRKKDMIIRREYNIYPALYEPTILQIPGVRDCALIGIYNDTKEDEEVVLVVVPEQWEDRDRIAAVVKRELANGNNAIDAQALPDRIERLFSLPVSGRSKKVDKRALRSTLTRSA